MIKCSRDGNETAIEVNGSAQVVAADCCEIISAIYQAAPSPAREPQGGRLEMCRSGWRVAMDGGTPSRSRSFPGANENKV